MGGAFHDGSLLLLTVLIDAAILGGWWFLGSRLLSPTEIPVASEAETEAGWLDRASTWICGFLLAGLIVEATGLMVVIVAKYGFVS